MTSANILVRCAAILTIAGAVLLLMMAGHSASAKSSRDAKRYEPVQARAAGVPRLAVVSLSNQRVTIYDANGKILESAISTGAAGYETPAGVYTVVQKKELHQSNLYEDGSMPFMQRITWTGIALHAGVLPGHPASHGCIRMPLAFAERLFGMTDMGMRVVVVRDDIAPMDVSHPVLFKSNAMRKDMARGEIEHASGSNGRSATMRDVSTSGSSGKNLEILKARSVAMSAEADAAVKRARDTKQIAAKKAAEAAPATRMLRAAEANHARAEKALKDAQAVIESASSPERTAQAELAKAKAQSKVAETEAQLQAAKAQAQEKTDAVARAGEAARAAEAAKDAAVEAADVAARKLLPVSVFISRKAQRLYIRQANQPVYEGPVVIRDVEKSIGTFVFTALEAPNNGADVRWSVVSMYTYSENAEPVAQASHRRGEVRNSAPAPADVVAATAALDRIAISQEIVDRISEVVLPGSSLIVSDEGPSLETGKDTDFVVIMSGEPQGGIKTRLREPSISMFKNRGRGDDSFGGSPFRGFPFFFSN